MYCQRCGTMLDDRANRCHNCGNDVSVRMAVSAQTRPLSAWAYYGYSLLYGIPILGFVFLIVNSFADNINLRNFTRMYWCAFIISIAFAVLASLILFGIIGLSFDDASHLLVF